ncbi:DUF6560 family protein [Paenibacillus chitinolyticus]|uniref:DUF6560 family protein n=1 Tax=Paenibacillus chitinolyticus TaxID=79263 RepID=UPI003D01A15B
MEHNLVQKLSHKMKIRMWASCLKPAKINQNGEMVISPHWFIKWGVFLLALVFVAATVVLLFDPKIKEEAVAACGMFALILGFCSIGAAISKMVINEETIRTYKWYGKKTIRFADITRVENTTLYGGAIVIRSNKKSITVTLENRGIHDFVKHLSRKLGSERVAHASAIISERIRVINSYQ